MACCIALVASSSLHAGQVYASLADQLAARSAEMSNLAVGYSYDGSHSWPGTDHKTLVQLQQQATKTQIDNERRDGVTDPKEIKKYVDSALASLSSIGQPWTHPIHGTVTVSSGQDGDLLLNSLYVEPQAFPYITDYHYTPGNVLVARYFKRSTDGPAIQDGFATIYKTSGRGVELRSEMFATMIDIQPEDLMLLAAVDPLVTYGGAWRTVAATANSTTIACDVTTGQASPFKITVTLDALHGLAPSDITIAGRENNVVYHVSAYKQHGDLWIPADYTLHRKWDTGATTDRHFLIQSIAPISGPIAQPTVTNIHDFRLLGTDLSPDDIHAAEVRNDPEMVTYSWNGKLPTIAELREMRYGGAAPGEKSPDPKQDGAALVGGLALFGAGLRMGKSNRKPSA
jgi:hypothetical protein